MKETGVTVLMPTFNQSSFLPRAITSLEAQTFDQWQLLIVNDGSTDCTEEVVQSFLVDNRITLI